MLRQVNIDGVLYKIGDSRFEGDNLAYIQLPESITVGTPLTDLAPIQKALDSTDGSLLYAPSLNVFFAPTASSTPATTRIWASTTGDKGYQLKATLNESGILSSAVVVEAPAADSGLVISAADWAQIKTEMEDDDNWDDTHTYLITDKAKEIAGKLGGMDASWTITGVDKFQIEHMGASNGVLIPVDYFYKGISLSDNGPIIEFISSGSELGIGGPMPVEIKYKLGTVIYAVDDDVHILGLLVSADDTSSTSPNICTDDYGIIEDNTSQLEPSEPYDDSALAKSIGQMLMDHFYNNDGSGYSDWDSDHFTVSQRETSINRAPDVALSFYTLSYIDAGAANYLKFTTTAEQYNGDIFVFFDDDYKTCLGMRIDPKPEDCVKVSKEYMEVPTGHAPHTCLEASISGTTLNITHKNESHISSVIHVPKSVLFTSPSAFKLKLAPNTDAGSAVYTPNAKFEISNDGLNWTQAVWDETNGISLVANTLNPELGKYSVFIRGDNHFNTIASKYSTFSRITGNNIEVSGILESLWGCKATASYCSQYLFANLNKLTSAKNLVLPNKVASRMCYYMFKGCTSLTQTPELPATTLENHCYRYMFEGCTSLVQAPVLPATILKEYCYNNMFAGCTSLTQAPVLPAVTLAESCYYSMFTGCTSLTSPPALPATTLAAMCYQNMFQGCTSLIQAPELPVTTLANYCYAWMFQGCTSLTQAPELPATTLADYCYQAMFSDCTALTQAPALPATTLAISCYYGMFLNCTLLTKPVDLPVVDIPVVTSGNMLRDMFKGCSGIEWATSGTPYIIRTPDGTVDVTAHLTSMFTGNGGGTAIPEGTGTPKLNTTYYYV